MRPASLVASLGVVEVGRHRDHGFADLLAEVGVGIGLEFGQDHRRDLLGRVLLARDGDFHAGIARGALDDLIGHHRALGLDFLEATAHEALDGIDRVLGIHDRLALGGLPHHPLAVLAERDHRRAQPSALRSSDHRRGPAFHDRHDAVGRAEVNTNDLRHGTHLSKPEIDCTDMIVEDR